jgi:hypothetical protein
MGRRGKIARAITIAAAALVVLAGTGIGIGIVDSANAIVVTTDIKPFHCKNPADLITVHERGRYIAGIRAAQDLDCELRIRIHNDGAFAADISRVRFSDAGNYGSIYFDQIDGMKSLGAADAVSDPRLQLRIEPGRTHVLTAHIRLPKYLCLSMNGFSYTTQDPTLTLQYLGMSIDRAPTSVSFGYTGAPYSQMQCVGSYEIPLNPYDDLGY